MNFKDNNIISIETKLPMLLLYINEECVLFENILIKVIDKDNKSITTICDSYEMRNILNTMTDISIEFKSIIIGSDISISFVNDTILKVRIHESLLSDISIGDIIILNKLYIGCIVNRELCNVFLLSNSIQQTGDKYEPIQNNLKEDFYCYSCGKPGHYINMCPQSRSDGCFRCGSTHHMARDCSKIDNRENTSKCYKCNKIGHYSKNCSNKDIVSNSRCFECGEQGHFARECTTSKKCYRCGNPDHFAKDCSHS